MELNTPTGRPTVGYLTNDPWPENALARLKLLRAAGRSPGNPKWYKAPTLPKQFVFKPGAKPVYPPQCKPTPQLAPQHESLVCVGGPFDGQRLAVSLNSVRGTLPFSLRGVAGHYERTENGRPTIAGKTLTWVPDPAFAKDLV